MIQFWKLPFYSAFAVWTELNKTFIDSTLGFAAHLGLMFHTTGQSVWKKGEFCNFVLPKQLTKMPHPLVSKFSSSFLDIRESVIETLFLVCNAIIVSRSTNLFVLKDYLPSLLENEQTHVLSHYKRLIRFFNYSNHTQLTTCILKWLYQLLSEQSKYLILDGTTWEAGDKYIHLLTLCIVYKNVAVPIYWKQLNKKGGHSSQEDRKLLFAEALKIFQLSGMILIADREFIGENWFRYLTDNQIDFVVRVSKTCYKLPVSKAWGSSPAYLEKRASKRKSPVGKRFTMGTGSYSFVAVKNTRKDEKEPVLFLVSSLTDFAKIAAIYKVRWKIETCFRQLKTKGRFAAAIQYGRFELQGR